MAHTKRFNTKLNTKLNPYSNTTDRQANANRKARINAIRDKENSVTRLGLGY